MSGFVFLCINEQACSTGVWHRLFITLLPLLSITAPRTSDFDWRLNFWFQLPVLAVSFMTCVPVSPEHRASNICSGYTLNALLSFVTGILVFADLCLSTLTRKSTLMNQPSCTANKCYYKRIWLTSESPWSSAPFKDIFQAQSSGICRGRGFRWTITTISWTPIKVSQGVGGSLWHKLSVYHLQAAIFELIALNKEFSFLYLSHPIDHACIRMFGTLKSQGRRPAEGLDKESHSLFGTRWTRYSKVTSLTWLQIHGRDRNVAWGMWGDRNCTQNLHF